jgi:molybdopterin converting factor small subunit
MGVQFKIPRQLQEKTDGAIHIEVRGCTVHECIADLIRRYPDLKGRILDGEGRVLLKWMVYINNESVILSNALSYAVKAGDIIAILPVVAGG